MLAARNGWNERYHVARRDFRRIFRELFVNGHAYGAEPTPERRVTLLQQLPDTGYGEAGLWQRQLFTAPSSQITERRKVQH
jgi:hypothetical protein